MVSWTFADVWEAVAAAQPDHPAFIQGDRVITWSEFDARADALAAYFLDRGLERQGKVAAFLFNGPEYIESYFAAFKCGFAPVNTNYRYGPEELFYLFDNADAQAVVFHSGFTEVLERIRGRLPGVKACGGGRARLSGPRLGDGLRCRGCRRPGGAAREGCSGAVRARTCCCSTPAAPPACPQGRDVGPGRLSVFNVIGGGPATPFRSRPIPAGGIGSRGWVARLADAVTTSGRSCLWIACPLMYGTPPSSPT